MSIIGIAISAIFINNFVLSKFLGICPFVGVSKKTESAIGMGIAVTFVMTLASFVAFLVYTFILKKYQIEYLTTICFILIIATLVQLVEMVIRKFAPPLYNALGIYLPLITTNCAVLGVVLINVDYKFNFISSIVSGFATGIGFMLALILMSAIREKLQLAKVPKILKGTPAGTIPVVSAENYFEINYKTAKESGLKLKEGLFYKADKIIR